MVKRFEALLARHPAMRSLDANRLFDTPAATIGAASDLFGVGLSRVEAAAIAEGPLFATYAKDPALPYDRAAVLATLYCTEPQAMLLNDAGFDAKTLPPGVPEP